MTAKEQYAAFCERQADLPLMYQPWWLEAVCSGNKWDVVLIKMSEVRSKKSDVSDQISEDDEVVAVLPYMTRKVLWQRFVVMPALTPYGGVWINRELQGSPDLQKKLAKVIVRRLRELKIAYYCQHYPISNPMAHWLGKQGMTILPGEASIEPTCQADAQLLTDRQMSGEEYYNFYKRCLSASGQKPSYSRELLLILERKARRADAMQIIRVREKTGEQKTVGAAIVVWDKYSLYCVAQSCLPADNEPAVSAALNAEVQRIAGEKSLQFEHIRYNAAERVFRLLARLLKRFV